MGVGLCTCYSLKLKWPKRIHILLSRTRTSAPPIFALLVTGPNFAIFPSAHAAGDGGDGAAARALPAVAGGDQEAHRGAHRARVPGAHARRPQSLHLRRIGS